MESKDYFAKAEKANKLYRSAVVSLLIALILVLIFSGAAVFVITQRNHANNANTQNTIIENEVKLNQNLGNAIQCILLLTPQTYNPTAVHNCFKTVNNITVPKG